MRPKEEYFQEVGRELVIPCAAHGDPPPTITWVKVGIAVFWGQLSPPQGQRLLLASRVSFLGWYFCLYITPRVMFLSPPGSIPNWGPITWFLKDLRSLCLAFL